MGAMFEIAQQRLEKFAQLLELPGVQQLAGVKHHGLELWSLAWNPRCGMQGFRAIAEHRIGEFAAKAGHLCGKRTAANQQRAFDGVQAPGLPALE